MNMNLDIANLISVVTGLLVLGACILLWLRYQTQWVLLALAGQIVSVLCRFVLFVPGAYMQYPVIRIVWPAGSLIFAIGLAGFAWTQYEASRQGTKS
ncbi:MAG TPA: hypothetical protein VLK26_08775 [Rudaea sp.]|nr:hypothetical protein [Rudaea sp.]